MFRQLRCTSILDTTPTTASVCSVAASSSAQSDGVKFAAADTTNTTATGTSPGPRSIDSTNARCGSRPRSASATALTPAIQGPVTSTASRR